MLLDVVIISLGFVGLTWGADKFVSGTSEVAKNLGVSPLMIGLTIVALGTSAPEIFSSAVAAINDQPALAIGNAIGSNIFNIGVALGLAVLIKPLTPPGSLLRKELPALLLVSLVTGVLFIDGYLGLLDSVVLIVMLAGLGYSLIRKKPVSDDDLDAEDEDEETQKGLLRAVIYLVFGLALLILSAEALVSAASSIAETIGVSAGVIGLTIVALGTSLPELATTVTCALRGHHDLAIGNIVGSNIMNILMVLPFPGLLAAGPIESSLLARDYVTMLAMTLLLAVICYRAIKANKQIGRLSGVIFLLMYLGWFVLLYTQL